MKSLITRTILAVAAMLCLLSGISAIAQTPDNKQVLTKASGAYYSLKGWGLVKFECDIVPNWDALLAGARKQDPDSANRAIANLKQIRFTVSMGATGSAKVTHTTIVPDNAQMAKGLEQVYTGMEQMITGFFDTWSPFMISSPFPNANSVYNLAEQGDHWVLSYKESGSTDVVTTIGKNLLIREMKVTTPQFLSTIHPQFIESPQGFLLSGYDADYSGQSPNEATKLKTTIAYQTVDNLQLPRTLDLSGSYGATPFAVEVTFNGCQVNKQ